MSRVYVVVEKGNTRVLGYHAINLGSINVDELERRPRGAPKHGEIPALFLGQVAVDKSAQGEGFGGILMHHVFEKAANIADIAGCFAIILDVISDDGEEAFARRKEWYKSFGFTPFPSDRARMFLPIRKVRAIVSPRRPSRTPGS